MASQHERATTVEYVVVEEAVVYVVVVKLEDVVVDVLVDVAVAV